MNDVSDWKALVLPASMSMCVWLLKKNSIQSYGRISFTIDPGYEQRAGEVQDAKAPPEAGSDGFYLNHQETGPNNFGEGARWIVWYVYIFKFIYIYIIIYLYLYHFISIYTYIYIYMQICFTYPQNWHLVEDRLTSNEGKKQPQATQKYIYSHHIVIIYFA